MLVNLISFVGLPAWGLGTAGTTLVGQALGARSVDDAALGMDVIRVGCPLMLLLGVPFWAMPELLLESVHPRTRNAEMATLPCRLLGIMIVLNRWVTCSPAC